MMAKEKEKLKTTDSISNKKETLGFQTEVTQLLDLMVHSLYSHKEIFLRELISNASDASDKLRFESIKNPKYLKDDPELKIQIDLDEKAKTLTIRDNGIGMSREDIIDHLGTIAKSGTKQFVESLTGDQSKDSQLIGQFGVGFYSVFMVAKKVVVTSLRAGLTSEEAVRWESAGDGKYSVENVTKESRGTEIMVYLKDDQKEYTDGHHVRGVITKYSDHIALPIEMKEMPKPDSADDSDKDSDKKDKKKDKKPEELKYETVNKAKALWVRSKSDITDEEYNEFYKTLSYDYQDPLTRIHSKVEGNQEYTSLFYIPSVAPFDLYDREQKNGIKLYINRVFIMDNAEIMPTYLRFVKGVLDSSDLPLNVSREILQNNKVIDKIKSASVKKIVSNLERMAKNDEESYKKFWSAFGNVIKEGVGEDSDNKDKLSKLMRFASTHNDTADQVVTLEDYVSRMKKDQKSIYYIIADSFQAAKSSPHLEIFRKKGIEVLLLSDRVDEWLTSHLMEFDGKPMKSIVKGELDIDAAEDEKDKKKQDKAKKDFEAITSQMKEVLADKVSEVRVTNRLTDSPACVVSEDHGVSMHLQRMMEQAGQKSPMMGMGGGKPIFEVNPEHNLVKQLKDQQDDKAFSEWTQLLFDQAMLAESGQLEDPSSFVKRMNDLLMK